jgi:hypothetical protein
VARLSGLTEWPNGVTRVDRDTRGASRADGHPDGCPTEGGRAPDLGRMGARRRARWVPDGGRVSGGGPIVGLGGGPTGEYIRAAGPYFWALSSNVQSHLQEMRVCRVLMRESVL